MIGSYTTFSTWMFEYHRLAEAGVRRAAAANVVAEPRAGRRRRVARAHDRRRLMSQPALELSVYFGERDHSGGRLLADVLMELFARRGIDTSMLLRGSEGFGLRHAC